MKKALVLTLAFALGLGIAAFAAPLSGSWATDITLTLSSGNLTIAADADFSSALEVDYVVGGWTFGSDTGFDLAGWHTQKFTAVGVLGAFSFDSTLKFSPVDVAFSSWDTSGSVSIAGVSFGGEFLLADGSGWTFTAGGSAGDLTIDAAAYFNMDSLGNLVQTGSAAYCFCFTGVSFTVHFPFTCIEDVKTTLSFSQSGFDYVKFQASGIDIPGISWLTFSSTLKFTVDTKTLTLTPALNLGTPACVDLYVTLESNSETYVISGLDIYAIGLSTDIGGVSFSTLSIWDATTWAAEQDPNGLESWYNTYWERFIIASSSDSCCGGNFTFSVATYFLDTHTTLFDWGMTDVDVSYGIGSNFTVSSGLVVKTTGLTELSLGFTVTW